MKHYILIPLLFLIFLTSCGGSDTTASPKINTADPIISITGLSRDDGQSLLTIGSDANIEIRDINFSVSLNYNITDIDDQAFGVAPSSSCRYRFGYSGDYQNGCTGIILYSHGGETLEYEIFATDSFGDTIRTITESGSYTIHKNTVPAYVSGLYDTSCNEGDHIQIPDAIFDIDAEGDSVAVEYYSIDEVINQNHTCGSAGTYYPLQALATDEYGDTSISNSFTITVCPIGTIADGTGLCF